MQFSIITPNYNGALFLERTIQSVLGQKESYNEIEYILVDGGSTDGSHHIIDKYRGDIDRVIIERDSGPANAINKGLAYANGEVVSWLNADDIYFPAILKRVSDCFQEHKEASFCFGKCTIVDQQDQEIRNSITGFKEFFFPFSSRFLHQSINYISQPAMFFKRKYLAEIGTLREDMVAAWDYEFMLKLWHHGKGVVIPGEAISAFRWHEASISGQNFNKQFKEEFDAAKEDAGTFAPQTIIHLGVRWGIVLAYTLMSQARRARN